MNNTLGDITDRTNQYAGGVPMSEGRKPNTLGAIAEASEKAEEGIALSDGSRVYYTRSAYIDEVRNTEQDLADIEKANERIIDPKDRRTIAILAALNILVFAFLGVFMVLTGGGDEYDSIKGSSVFNMKKGYYDPSVVFIDELYPDYLPADYPGNIQPKFKALLSENEDTVGWISIDGTQIDYPVVQAEDNSYYERRDFDGTYSVRGVIFMDYRNTVPDNNIPFSKNTVIYGHHMVSDRSMFTILENYSDIEYYREHPIIEYDTLYGNYKWKVIGAFINYPNDPSEGSDLFYYWFTDFCDENTVAFANEVATRSYFINTSVDVKPTDKFLTLSTCTYMTEASGETKGRFVVVARLIRDGEKEKVDVDKAYVNTNQRMPQIWYDSYGQQNPYANVPIWVAY